MFPKIVGFPPKSSILIGFSIINDPFWGTPIFGNTHMLVCHPLAFGGIAIHRHGLSHLQGLGSIFNRDSQKKPLKMPLASRVGGQPKL